ncbi:MAG: hypothetical protein V9G04_13220 [Nocardioides sp.]
MTPNQPTEGTESARSALDLALAYARRPGTNDRQKPTRRQQMLNAAAYAALKLEEAAEHAPDPDELRLAAEGLRVAALRLVSPKPRRKPAQHLPRPGRATRVARDVSLEELTAAAALARAVTDAHGIS